MFKSNFEIEQHRYLALFHTIFYVKPWIQCPLLFEATVNDLGFSTNSELSVQGKSNLSPFFNGFNNNNNNIYFRLKTAHMKNTHSLHTHKKKLQKARSSKGTNIWHTSTLEMI